MSNVDVTCFLNNNVELPLGLEDCDGKEEALFLDEDFTLSPNLPEVHETDLQCTDDTPQAPIKDWTAVKDLVTFIYSMHSYSYIPQKYQKGYVNNKKKICRLQRQLKFAKRKIKTLESTVVDLQKEITNMKNDASTSALPNLG